MGRTCTICRHNNAEEINKQLIRGDSIAEIARHFATSEDALSRHKESHISEVLLKSQDAINSLKADNTFSEYQKAKKRLEDLQARTYDLLAMAEAETDHRACIGYIREILGLETELREQRRLLAELEGRLAAQPQITIINNPEWVELRTLIINALDPYPEAKAAVVHAIHK